MVQQNAGDALGLKYRRNSGESAAEKWLAKTTVPTIAISIYFL
jgi:hypothetical protein